MNTFAHHPDPAPPRKGEMPSLQGEGGDPPTAQDSNHASPSHPSPSQALPSPTDERAIIERLLSPDHSLTDIAAHFNTTTESLILWMSRPDIASRLDTSNTALAFRARLAATSCLPSVIASLDNILTDFNRKPAATPPTTAPDSRTQPALTPELLRLRRAETAHKAGTLLVRLCHLRPLPANATAPQRAATSPPSPARTGRGKGDESAQLTKAPATAILDPTTPSAEHVATSSLRHSATSSPQLTAPTNAQSPMPSASLLQSEGLAVRSRGVEGGTSPTDTPGKPPRQSQSEGLLVASTPQPAPVAMWPCGNVVPPPSDNVIPPSAQSPMPDAFPIPDRASFPDDDAWINHLAQLVGIDPAELDNADLPESLLANTS